MRVHFTLSHPDYGDFYDGEGLFPSLAEAKQTILERHRAKFDAGVSEVDPEKVTAKASEVKSDG